MSAFLKTLKFTRYNPVPNGQQNRKSSSQFPKKFPQKHLRIFPAPWLFLTGYGTSLIEIFHMSSRRPYWCPKTITRRPFWCFKQVLGTNLKPPVLCASAQGDKDQANFPSYLQNSSIFTNTMSINLRLKFHRIRRYSQSGWKF